MQSKLVDNLPFLHPFWILRVGDWIYLFDHPNGALIGRIIARSDK